MQQLKFQHPFITAIKKKRKLYTSHEDEFPRMARFSSLLLFFTTDSTIQITKPHVVSIQNILTNFNLEYFLF